MTGQVQKRCVQETEPADRADTRDPEPKLDPKLDPDYPCRDAAPPAAAGRVIFEMDELTRENRWEEIITRFYPVEEKLAHLVSAGTDIGVRGRAAFALSQMKRFDEAIGELQRCTAMFPDNFQYQGSLAYNAYNSLYAAKNREIVLPPAVRKERIEMAHHHFKAAQNLRPDGVTNFYRQGMLYHEIENKPERAVGLFLRAAANWEGLSPQVRQARHQEMKNYIKSLYQGARAILELGGASQSLELMEKCLAADETSNHVERVFKYFALGKIRFALGQHENARDALRFALKSCRKNQPADYVHELLGRTYLALGDPRRALESLRQVPENRRRPYIRWTEADALCALNQTDEAWKILTESAERDRLSRHKTLIRLAQMAYASGNFTKAVQLGGEADRFFREKWTNRCAEGCYWQAMSLVKLGKTDQARKILETLEKHNPRFERLEEMRRVMG
jgi:tetratricopeptide (TPR) repeat protein